MQQVLVNLLENAARHTPAGTPIEITASRGRPIGRGRGGRSRARACRRAIRSAVREVLSARRSGAQRVRPGIGHLPRNRGVARGKIRAENRPGGGAVFRFSLPLGENPPALAVQDA